MGQPDQCQPRPGAQPLMRRSCHFCRSRKIRCSGHRICNACQDRNIDCVYGREGTKGRPRLHSAKPPRRGSSQKPRETYSSKEPGELQNRVDSNPAISPESTVCSSPAASTVSLISGDYTSRTRSTWSVLEAMFDFLFFGNNNIYGEYYDDATQAFAHRRAETLPQPFNTDQCPPSIAYNKPMSMMMEDYVAISAMRFTTLRPSASSKAYQDRFFRVCLDRDRTASMFDASQVQQSNPLDRYTDHQISQMIEVWFSHHPLAFIISKTLFLQSYRNACCSRILLAAMLADVRLSQDGKAAELEANDLFQWAVIEMKRLTDLTADLPTIQSLTLMAWHQMCSGRARLALPYFFIARRLLAQFQTPVLQLNQMNGVDVAKVEREIAQNLHCLSYSTLLWIFLQCDVSVRTFEESAAMIGLPPSDQSKSASYTLDVASDNTSTLAHQAKTIRSLWPLSHMAATIARVSYLLSQSTQQPKSSPRLSTDVNGLSIIPSTHEPFVQGSQIPAARARALLSKISSVLQARLRCRITRETLLSAYHALTIHLLFPRESVDIASPLSDSLMDEFSGSVKVILSLVECEKDGSGAGRMHLNAESASNPAMVVLGLDACCRALKDLQDRSQVGAACSTYTVPQDVQRLQALGTDLRILKAHNHKLTKAAKQLYAASKDPSLQGYCEASTVKKQLKQVVRIFENDDSSLSESRGSCDLELQVPDPVPFLPLESPFDSASSMSSSCTPLTLLSTYGDSAGYQAQFKAHGQRLTGLGNAQMDSLMPHDQSSSSISHMPELDPSVLDTMDFPNLDPRTNGCFAGFMDAFVLDGKDSGIGAISKQCDQINGNGALVSSKELDFNLV